MKKTIFAIVIVLMLLLTGCVSVEKIDNTQNISFQITKFSDNLVYIDIGGNFVKTYEESYRDAGNAIAKWEHNNPSRQIVDI